MQSQTTKERAERVALLDRKPTSVLVGPPKRASSTESPVNLRTVDAMPSALAHASSQAIAAARRERALVRAFDLTIGILAVVLLAPVLLLMASLILLTSQGAPMFSHPRIGRDGESFRCLKFRSMFSDAAPRLEALLRDDPNAAHEWAATQKIRNDPRVTLVGRFIRKTNLDELPQLLNVIKGDMSIVGPRPIVTDETIRYGEALPIMLSVKPGMTGLWQVSGRNNTTYDERVRLDVEYVLTRSLFVDLQICFRTAALSLRPTSNGAY